MTFETPSETVTGEVTSWAYGGAGILRHAGLAVFIPFSCRGDHLSAMQVRRCKNYAEAAIDTLHVASPHRVQPRCPVYGQCGGCQLQHVSYSEQLFYKQQSVRDALERIAGLKNIAVNSTHPADQEWYYRRHITLHLRNGVLGFISNDNRTISEPLHCALFNNEPILFQELRSIIQYSPDSKITLIKEGLKYLIDWKCSKKPVKKLAELLEASTLWLGGTIRSPETVHTFGVVEGTCTYQNCAFQFSLGSFIQNHPGQSSAIYSAIVEHAKAIHARRILDLYCGVGIIGSLLCRQGCEVDGIEWNSQAVQAARANIVRYAAADFDVHEGAVEKVLPRLKKNYDLVVVNPPRSGLHPQALAALIKLNPPALVYLSCMPSTLARDVKMLSSHYNVIFCQPYDMFPQTSHVETLVFFSKI